MEPSAFVAEVYRRMSLRHKPHRFTPSWEEIESDPVVPQATHHYNLVLPANKNSAILDIGFGRGWFIAACIKLGYSNISGAEFGAENRQYVKDWSSSVKGIHNIETNIGDFLKCRKEQYDFIHLAHVIEHVPKYSLLYVFDALYLALKRGGTLFVRTPNMEGPCPASSMYVTLGHEYAFCGSNLVSLLHICNFVDIEFHQFGIHNPTMKQRLGVFLRWPFIKWNLIKHRLFGVNHGGQFRKELIVSATRGNLPALFDEKYK